MAIQRVGETVKHSNQKDGQQRVPSEGFECAIQVGCRSKCYGQPCHGLPTRTRGLVTQLEVTTLLVFYRQSQSFLRLLQAERRALSSKYQKVLEF